MDWARAATITFVVCATAMTPTAVNADGFAIIYNGQKQDGGFNEAALQGVKRAKRQLDIRVRERVVANVDEAEKALRVFARRDVEHLLTVGFSNTPAVKAAAEAFPQAKFTLIDGVVEAANVKSMLFREDQAGFLAGAVAGLKTESDRLGFIGGMPIPPVKNYGCGFLQGARYVNEDVRMDWRYIGDSVEAFRDREKAASIANALFSDGADVVFPAAGYAGKAALKAAAKADAYAVGVDVNQNAIAPGHVLTSAVKRVDQAVYLSWKAAVNGTWQAGVRRLGVSQDGVGYAVDANNRALIAGVKPRVERIRTKLAAGKIAIKVPDAAPACGPDGNT